MPRPVKRRPAPVASATLDDVVRATVRAWMQTGGVSQDTLAARLGKTQAWASRYLSGEIQLGTLEEAVRLAGAFGQTLAALLDLTPNRDDAELLDTYRALPPADRDLALRMIRRLSRAPRGAGR